MLPFHVEVAAEVDPTDVLDSLSDEDLLAYFKERNIESPAMHPSASDVEDVLN